LNFFLLFFLFFLITKKSALLGSTADQITWSRIPQTVVADGKRFFIDKESQKKGEWPAVIHNNYAVGAEHKRQRFVNVSLWLLDEDLQCRGFQHFPSPLPSKEPVFYIKILTFNRPKALARLLESLDQAQISRSENIQLDFFVDYPDADDEKDPVVMRDRDEVGPSFLFSFSFLLFSSFFWLPFSDPSLLFYY